MNLNLLILYVTDVPTMRAFYSEKIGLPVSARFNGPVFVAFEPSVGSLLAIQDKTTADLPPGEILHNKNVEVSFLTEDVDGLCQQWQAKGVEIVTPPTDMPFGRYFKAKDPEGHYVSAYCPPQG